jgi:signal transduction histidine kinase
VLINLLSNAIKFSEAGKPISVWAVQSQTMIIIQVKDQGMGIAPEDLPHLFTTFYRGKNVVNIQGTGLGLHIVKRYIDKLNAE